MYLLTGASMSTSEQSGEFQASSVGQGRRKADEIGESGRRLDPDAATLALGSPLGTDQRHLQSRHHGVARSTSSQHPVRGDHREAAREQLPVDAEWKRPFLPHISVIFVTKIKTSTIIIGRRFQRTRTRIIVIQKTKTK